MRRRFKPALLVEELLSGEPRSRQAISRAVKRILTEEEAETSHQALCQLPAQGAMARLWEKASPELWVKAVQGLPPEPLIFALNASLDTLPTNTNLHTCGKKPRDICPLYQDYRQSLLHALNHCKVAMDLRQYSRRHDGDFVQSWLPSNYSLTIDLPSLIVYRFPHHNTPTNMRPDMVWWSDQLRELWLFELTISYESNKADS